MEIDCVGRVPYLRVVQDIPKISRDGFERRVSIWRFLYPMKD